VDTSCTTSILQDLLAFKSYDFDAFFWLVITICGLVMPWWKPKQVIAERGDYTDFGFQYAPTHNWEKRWLFSLLIFFLPII
jgi:hypothetical protein